ncbi:MAG: hypothetical protein M3083_18615 [Actinomycetota bacterium]|nr:hypothetical protein [Actinomycetota bacterium]
MGLRGGADATQGDGVGRRAKVDRVLLGGQEHRVGRRDHDVLQPGVDLLTPPALAMVAVIWYPTPPV